ncbi:AMP-binding protein [Halomonas lysinitropha]|uniref:Long-chain-fatty-acid--CoA ligase n=1 Tax=Halomonas lysinitropha TaxID=2607506 RepID=A0A5K1I513_9GAMM|nr:AMP-binding protein [Halomonas lysinitropha]VVZ96586.1 Long-chain-fatty-acid--CoA ligase [Halomonas lysinitropha]
MDTATLNELIVSRNIDDRHEAIVSLGRDTLGSTSRRDLLDRAARLAGGLRQQGLVRGDRVVIMAPNSVDWVVSALGILHVGGVVVPLDTQMPQEDLEHALGDCAPCMVFTTAALRSRLSPLPGEVALFLFDGDGDDRESGRAWQDLLQAEPVAACADGKDLATIFYTSGTTGPPKGVPLTHHNMTSNVEALCTQELADSSDRVLVPLPFHHVYPFTVGILVPFTLGASIIVPFSLVGPQIVRALREGEATVMLAVPRLYEAIWSALHERVAERGRVAALLFSGMLGVSMAVRQRLGWNPGKQLFASLHQRIAPRLRLMVAGGAALDPELGRKLRGLGWDVATGYGLSETSPILTMNPPEKVKLESVGKALPGVELAIDDREGRGRGEVLARGPNVFGGYWNLPDKTRESLDEEGWFHTGDTGSFDAEGHLYLHGRASAMIVLSGGENVDPERVEKALEASDRIRETGLLAHADRLAVVVVPAPGLLREVTGDELRRTLEKAVSEISAALPSHHRPGEVRVSLDPLPRTRLGKLRRHKLEALFEHLEEGDEAAEAVVEPLSPEDMAPEDQQLLSDPAADSTWRYLARRFHDIRLTPDSHLAMDLGIDSLSWVDLTLALREHAGIDLEDSAIARVETVRDLLNEAAAGPTGSEGEDEDLVEALRNPEGLLDDRQRRALMPPGRIHGFMGWWVWGLARLISRGLLRVSVSGQWPDRMPCVIAPRHLSVLDPLVLLQIMDRCQAESLYWAGWTGMLFTGRVRRGFSRIARILPIDPGTAPRRSLVLASAALDRGHQLVWFPEGQRSPDGRLQPFRPGLGLLLRAQPVPVVPVWIEGTHELMPPGQRLPRRGRVRVVIGEPVDPERLEGDEREIIERLQDEMAALGERRLSGRRSRLH